MNTPISKQESGAFDRDPSTMTSAEFLGIVKDRRVAIEGVTPQIDGGRFPVKRAIDDTLTVEADIYCDGHDKIAAMLLFRCEDEAHWHEVPMRALENDRWRGEAPLQHNGRIYFTILAWRDLFSSWTDEVTKKFRAGLPIELELEVGRRLVEMALEGPSRASPNDINALRSLLRQHPRGSGSSKTTLDGLTAQQTADLMGRVSPRTNATRYDKQLEVWVDRRRAAFSAWYELFPRSQSGDTGRHGTFDDVIARLPYLRDLGFDVLVMP
jgi:starch synthase (maltosyl-transferring)